MKPPKVGRTTYSVIDVPWPMVSRLALSDLQMSGTAHPDWNQEIHALATGYVHLHNLEINLKAVAKRTKRKDVKARVNRLLDRLNAVKLLYPITLMD